METLSNEEPVTEISDETVVLNAPVFSLDSFPADVLKETFPAESQAGNGLPGLPGLVANVGVGANLIQRPDGSVILDTTRGFTSTGGLILSVTEEQANHLTHLGSVNDAGQVQLNAIQAQPLTATAQLLPSSEGLVVNQSNPSVTQLFRVSDDGLTTSTAAEIQQITGSAPAEISSITTCTSSQDPLTSSVVREMKGASLATMIHVRNDPQLEPKRKKGGWPKGKRRKPERESNVPKSPATAYVIFAISRRQELKKEQPELTFVQATKQMGTEWTNMSSREKEKYIKEAEADKKRYIEELREYQNSEAYINFQRRKKQRTNAMLEDGENNGDGNFLDDLEEEGLYCSLCDQYFSSMHNRKEHMFGKQHLQNMTSEFEKDLRESNENANSESSDSPELSRTDGHSEDSDSGNISFNATLLQPEAHGQLGALIQNFMQTFIIKNAEREMEALSLARTLDSNREAHANLVNRIQVYKEIITKLEHQLGNLKAYGAALATQIDTLRMVPMLFGVVNKWAM